MAKCEECNKEMRHQKRRVVGVNGHKVCPKCYATYGILDQMGLPSLDDLFKKDKEDK